MNKNVRRLIVLAAFAAASASAVGQTAVDATDRGWYARKFNGTTITGFEHFPTNTNYITGRSFSAPNIGGDYRSFFAFDLGAYAGQTITGATLHLFNPVNGFFQFNPAANPGPFETLEIWDVSTSSATLSDGSALEATWTDLGSGTLLGTVNVSAADNGQFVDVLLNSAGLAAINAALGGHIAFGGRIGTINSGAGTQQVFAWTNPDVIGTGFAQTQLLLDGVTPVPEPETYAMLIAGLALLGLRARRQARLTAA